MKVAYVLAATVAFALSAPAAAGDNDADKANTGKKEQKICRTQTVTGSLVTKRRTCMTAKEWQELAAKTKQSIDEFTHDAAFPQQGANPLGG